MSQTSTAQAAAQYADASDFASLLNQEFRPKTDQAREAVESAVKTLAEQALAASVTVSDDAYESIAAIIAGIDRKLTEQINLILHHPDFQQLESTWRGVFHLVSNTETDEKLKIRCIDVSKDDLRRTMKRFKGVAWDQSPLFKQIYEQEYGQLGGEPYGCLIADYYFDHTPPDVDLLGSIARIAASAHTPFIAGAAPSVLQMESWQELANPRDLTKIFTQNLEYAPWNSLRNTEDARYIGLTMPRFLARLPYGAKSNPVDEFAFEEDTAGADHASPSSRRTISASTTRTQPSSAPIS
ncbi:type VI secretion system contractile sheath large subunit [Thauera sinica]|uniref:Type VI secretion system contractile sheath large subunit n=1 Tax=Thauera sinica TaxID=2665146 RepID=A0ABW1AT90_9RHOO|nr:type VI secretion system contractile sheath large subunit [Thauera sp. K11]